MTIQAVEICYLKSTLYAYFENDASSRAIERIPSIFI